MLPHVQVKHTGTIGDVFPHCFILEIPQGNVLADLGPRDAEFIHLNKGERVHLGCVCGPANNFDPVMRGIGVQN